MLTEAHAVGIGQFFLFSSPFSLVQSAMLNGKHDVSGRMLQFGVEYFLFSKYWRRSDDLDQMMSALLSDPAC
jgi:hypothetical protein